jgi:hypothetical protein
VTLQGLYHEKEAKRGSKVTLQGLYHEKGGQMLPFKGSIMKRRLKGGSNVTLQGLYYEKGLSKVRTPDSRVSDPYLGVKK